jgi:ketosteroid isomerase-like protein
MSSSPGDETDPDRLIVLAAYAAFGVGDIEGAVAGLAEDVVWIEPDEFPNGGRHDGRAAVARYLAESYAGWRDVRSMPTAYRRGAQIVVEHHLEGTLLDGTPRSLTVADVFTVEDGQVVHMQAYARPSDVPAA